MIQNVAKLKHLRRQSPIRLH